MYYKAKNFMGDVGENMRREKNKARTRRRVIRFLIFPAILIFVTLGTYIFWSKNEDLLMGNSFNKAEISKQKEEGQVNESKTEDKDNVKKEDKNKKDNNKDNVNKQEQVKDYQYDAKIIEERLRTYNYSNNGDKMVFLTFDDGTSTTVTPKILDILDRENVKATFFVTGKVTENGGEAAKELLKREYNSGQSIGNHSYSHDYHILYPSGTLNLDNFLTEYNKNDEVLKSILGSDFSTRLWRCPGGTFSWKGMSSLKEYAANNNKVYIDWNSSAEDAVGSPKNADQLYDNVVKYSEGKDVVVLLMHDTYGKEESAKALPRIIQYFKSNGYKFKTLV